MSLVGNLEDLSLGDLLQIVSLSQKSGVLALESPTGSGQIVFRSGLVLAAGVKGRSTDLRGLLVEAGRIDPKRLDDALAASPGKRASSTERIAEQAGLDLDELEGLIRRAAESAIFEMFSWTGGEFSFDAGREEDGEHPYPRLRSGINAQYLAMEGLRLRDEQARGETVPEIELTDEPYFGSEPLEIDPDAELDLETEIVPAPRGAARAPRPRAKLAPESPRESVPALPDCGPTAQRVDEEAVEVVVARAVVAVDGPGGAAAPAVGEPQNRPVVVIDPDAAVLEWIKASIEGRFARVHVFQRAEQGLARIRQYLIRGEVPFVLIALSAPIDPLSGIHGLADFVKRLRAQAPRILVVGLREESDERPAPVPGHLDALLARPPRGQLQPSGSSGPSDASGRAAQFVEQLDAIVAKRGVVVPAAVAGVTTTGDRPAVPRGSRDSIADLQNAQSQNDVFAVMLEAAARIFARAAILVLRDGEIFAVSGRGIDALAVDPLAASPRLSCPIHASLLVQRLIDTKRPITGNPRSPADRTLVSLFGPIEPTLAYLAPIRLAGGALAVLYADPGGGRKPMPDTRELEALLDEAGAALEIIAAERAKGEARPSSS